MGKGGGFEREISTKLSLWWTDGKRDDCFWRSQASGGRATIRGRKGKAINDQYGDIVAVDEEGKPLTNLFSFECKTGYGKKKKNEPAITNWCVLDALDSKQKQTVLEAFWEQCERDAGLSCRFPILIFRRNRKEAVIAFETILFQQLKDYYEFPEYNLIRIDLPVASVHLMLMKLEDFFDWIPDIRGFINGKIRGNL